jgi:hypothetical protein
MVERDCYRSIAFLPLPRLRNADNSLAINFFRLNGLMRSKPSAIRDPIVTAATVLIVMYGLLTPPRMEARCHVNVRQPVLVANGDRPTVRPGSVGGRTQQARQTYRFFLAAPFFLVAAAVLRLGFLTGAFTFARADFLFGLGNSGFETAVAADFCSSGPAASSFAPPLLTASTTNPRRPA